MFNVECSMLNVEREQQHLIFTVNIQEYIQHLPFNIQHSTFNIQRSTFLAPCSDHASLCQPSPLLVAADAVWYVRHVAARAFLALFVTATAFAAQFELPRRSFLIDEVVPIVISGLPPGESVTIRARGRA